MNPRSCLRVPSSLPGAAIPQAQVLENRRASARGEVRAAVMGSSNGETELPAVESAGRGTSPRPPTPLAAALPRTVLLRPAAGICHEKTAVVDRQTEVLSYEAKAPGATRTRRPPAP